MADLKRKGDLAELAVATDLVRRGYQVAFPFGEDWDCDLIVLHPAGLARVQVKYVTRKGDVVEIRCRSHSLTGGKVRQTKQYTRETIDVLAAYEPSGARCFYVPAEELGTGMNTLTLRLHPARNNQTIGIRMASDYEDPRFAPANLEPLRGRGANGNTRRLQR